MAASKKGGLGKGLGALLEETYSETYQEMSLDEIRGRIEGTGNRGSEKQGKKGDSVRLISIHDVKPNADQPRKAFDEEKLEDLAASIRENGVIQPVIVRERESGFQIVAGERRWRAAMKAGLSEIPCIVRNLTDEENMLFAIIENMQREDLNPLEEAEGIDSMMTAYGLTQEQIAKSVGKSRSYIANAVRLLRLPEPMKSRIASGELSAAHGRTLAGIGDAKREIELAQKIVSEGLSVRETERIASGEPETGKRKKRTGKQKDANLLKVEEDLKEKLGTKVSIKQSGEKGRIEIDFYSGEELERLIDLLREI